MSRSKDVQPHNSNKLSSKNYVAPSKKQVTKTLEDINKRYSKALKNLSN